MAGLSLEPVSMIQTWKFPEAASCPDAVIIEYIQNLARHVSDLEPACLIGHIKGLVLFGTSGYMRVSAVSGDIPACFEGGLPKELTVFELTVSALVFNVSRNNLEKMMIETAERIAKKWNGNVRGRLPAGTGMLPVYQEKHIKEEMS